MTKTELIATLAPCMIEHHHGAYLITDLRGDESQTGLVQTDWDYPSLANNLIDSDGNGIWSPPSNSTDGTVDCPETGKTASEMICEAGEALDSNVDCVLYMDPWTLDHYTGNAD